MATKHRRLITIEHIQREDTIKSDNDSKLGEKEKYTLYKQLTPSTSLHTHTHKLKDDINIFNKYKKYRLISRS